MFLLVQAALQRQLLIAEGWMLPMGKEEALVSLVQIKYYHEQC